jgi:hypothetical protein
VARYLGEYPTAPLQDGKHGGFQVDVRVHFTAAAATAGTLSLTPGWTSSRSPTARRGLASATPASVSVAVAVPAGASNQTVSVKAGADAIKLWWPAGMGAQPLCAQRDSSSHPPAPARHVIARALAAGTTSRSASRLRLAGL